MKQETIRHFGDDAVSAADWNSARIVILPLCYESAPSYGAGAGEGPRHILEASVQLEQIDEETLMDWGTLPIHTLPALYPDTDPETAVGQMKRAAETVLKENKFLLSLGGDHAASIGPMMAAARHHPDIGVLQVDAHLDLRDRWNGSRFNHACVMRRAAEMNLPLIQVGIRSFSKEEAEFVASRKLAPILAHQIDPGDRTWIDRAIAALPEKVYITIDLDGLDPSVVPGTGTPEPGGLSYRQLVDLIKAVGRNRQVVAADITELTKIKGVRVSEFIAAKIVTKILVHCFSRSDTHS